MVAAVAGTERAYRPAHGGQAHWSGHAIGAPGLAALAQSGAAKPLRPVPSTTSWPSASVLDLLQKSPGVWVNQWQEVCEDQALLNHFEKLPGNVYKVEADKQMIALYWGEKGEAEVLQQIDATLKALA